MPEISGTQTFSASVAKKKGLPFGLFSNLEKTSLKTPLFFFIIKLVHLYVVFRSKAHKCQRFDTKL